MRALAHPKLKEVNERALADLKEHHFTLPSCKEAFKRLQAFYLKKGRILTWKELIADASISPDSIKNIRSREVKRKNLEKHDASLKLPRNYDEYSSLISTLHFNSQHYQLIEFQNELTKKLSDGTVTKDKLERILKFATKSLDTIKEIDNGVGNLVKLNKKNVRDILRNFYVKLKNNWFIPTGYKAFDSKNLGIPLDSYFLLSAKTGAGKSSLALDMAIKMKMKGARVCFVPLEMSIEQNLLRIGSNLTKIPIVEIVNNLKSYYRPIMHKVDKLLEETDDNPSCFHFYEPEVDETVVDILNTLKVGKYDIIIVDYIGLTAPLDSNEAKDLGLASRFAKVYATANKTIVCYLAQLDEEKARVRYARKLVEDASNAWIWKQTKEEVAELGYIQITQKKARNQDPFSFKLKANLACCRLSTYRDGDTGDQKLDKKLDKQQEPIEDISSDVPTDSDI